MFQISVMELHAVSSGRENKSFGCTEFIPLNNYMVMPCLTSVFILGS